MKITSQRLIFFSFEINFVTFFFFLEYVSVLKDKTKTVEKLEAMVEKQQDGKCAQLFKTNDVVS